MFLNEKGVSTLKHGTTPDLTLATEDLHREEDISFYFFTFSSHLNLPLLYFKIILQI